MTISTDCTPDDAAGKGTAIDVLPTSKAITLFSPEAAKPVRRGLRDLMFAYSAHAAMIVGLLGFAWTVGNQVVHRPLSTDLAPTPMAAVTPIIDPMASLRDENRALAATVHGLQARLDALQTSIGDHDKVAAQVRVLQAGLDSVKTGLGAARTEHSTAVSRLDGKIDKLAQQHGPNSQVQQPVDRQGKLERGNVDVAPTASLPRADSENRKFADSRSADAMPAPPPRPNDLARTGDLKGDPKPAGADNGGKPPVIAGWVVRDVYEGVALLEGRHGTIEVVPGVGIPGAGVVKSIDRRGSGWTVTTTKGLVAFAAAPRDNRSAERAPYGRDYAPRYGYDF